MTPNTRVGSGRVGGRGLSPTLGPMSRQVAELRHAAVVAELNEERAATLGRADRRISAARERGLQALALLDAGHDTLAGRTAPPGPRWTTGAGC